MERISEKQERVIKPSSVEVVGDILKLIIEGKSYAFQIPSISKRLASASDAARQNFVLSPFGYGIHWPDVDEDLSIPALIKNAK